MSSVNTQARAPKPKRSALSVWELPKLLRSVHRYRKSKLKTCRERPHYRAILAFVHRHRFAVASQIQRRFPKYLPSDRTARRHLAEMESLGFLGLVETNNVSPLWPKVYFVTRRGLARLRQVFQEQGKEWSETLRDRRRSEGVSAQHVLHEILTTEFLLHTWADVQARDDLEILTTQRRSLAKHSSFKVVVGGRPTRLLPDGMFLYRQKGRGLMCCFVEIDLDSMSVKQMIAKFRRYQLWAESTIGTSYLKALYVQHGATAPTAAFRILIVIGSSDSQAENRRLLQLAEIAQKFPSVIRERTWLTTMQHFSGIALKGGLTPEAIWQRPSDLSVAGKPLQLKRNSLHSLFGTTQQT